MGWVRKRTAPLVLVFLSQLLPAAAQAHAKGFHKRDVVKVSKTGVEILITLDIDGGERTAMLRGAADANHDRRLSAAEIGRLKETLVGVAERHLALSLSGYRLSPKVREAKLNLREDRGVSDSPLSIAVLLTAELSSPPSPGLELVVGDESPDRSHVAVEVYQPASTGDGGAQGAERASGDLLPGQNLRVRIGSWR